LESLRGEQPDAPLAAGDGLLDGIDSPEETIQIVLQQLYGGNWLILWEMLPPSYQQDVNGLVNEFAENMDEQLWNETFETASKAIRVLEEQKEFILQNPMLEEVADAQTEAVYDALVGMLSTIVNSEISDLNQLQSIELGTYLATMRDRLSESVQQLAALIDAEQMGEPGQPELLAVNVTTLQDDGDRVTLRVEIPDFVQDMAGMAAMGMPGMGMPGGEFEGDFGEFEFQGDGAEFDFGADEGEFDFGYAQPDAQPFGEPDGAQFDFDGAQADPDPFGESEAGDFDFGEAEFDFQGAGPGMVGPMDEEMEVEMVRVQGRWLPADLVDDWETTMAEIRAAFSELRQIDPQEKQQYLMGLNMINGVLDQLLAANTAEEFNQVIGEAMGAMMGAMGETMEFEIGDGEMQFEFEGEEREFDFEFDEDAFPGDFPNAGDADVPDPFGAGNDDPF
jgi:hypothetical protein